MKRNISILLSIAMILTMSTLALADGIDGPKQEIAVGAREVTDVIKVGVENSIKELQSDGTIEATTVLAPSDWAKESVDMANKIGITNKTEQYIYKNPITREEFCELIYNYVNVIGKVRIKDGQNKFSDTTNAKIIALNNIGIINGRSETEFAPNDYLTREEAAVILTRMVNKTISIPVTEMYFTFEDEAQISDWANDSIQVMCNMGVMNGVGNNKFAPKEIYITEQAIATIVRVSEAQDVNIGIIGGANGPTDVYVTTDDKVIGGADAPTEIYIGEDVEVDDFYVNEAIKLTTESGKFAATKEFVALYSSSKDINEIIENVASTDYKKPTEIYYIAFDRDKIIKNLNAMYENENADFDVETVVNLNKFSMISLASMINSSYGSKNIAALTILTNKEGYIMPKDFKNNFALYLKYDGGYSSMVAFSQIGEGVIEGQMSFVKDGDKDGLFLRLGEIIEGLGEDTITVGKVK